MRSKGKIASWNDDKGYGFIAPTSGGKQIFCHVSALSNRKRTPAVGDVVSYSVSSDGQGRPCAADAKFAGDRRVKKTSNRRNPAGIIFSMSFLAVMGLSALIRGHTIIPFAAYVALSLVTFGVYAYDKSAAERGAWRISEAMLWTLGLVGGWPGAVIAQQTLRHKSKKTSFRIVFWTTVVLNCAVPVWIHTESGRNAIQLPAFQQFAR